MSTTSFPELEDFRVDWNSASREASALSDDELINFIQKYEKLILNYKIKKEAYETEAERRAIRKPKFKLDRTLPDQDTQVMVDQRAKRDKEGTKKLDKAFAQLKAL